MLRARPHCPPRFTHPHYLPLFTLPFWCAAKWHQTVSERFSHAVPSNTTRKGVVSIKTLHGNQLGNPNCLCAKEAVPVVRCLAGGSQSGVPLGCGAMGCGASSSAPVSEGTSVDGEGGGEKGQLGRRAEVETEYKLGQVLGEGAFASARLAERKSDRLKVAIKTLHRNHKLFDVAMLKNEIQVMRACDHPRCIQLLDVIEDKKCVHLVEEVAHGGELFDRITNMPSGHLTERDAAYLVSRHSRRSARLLLVFDRCRS